MKSSRKHPKTKADNPCGNSPHNSQPLTRTNSEWAAALLVEGHTLRDIEAALKSANPKENTKAVLKSAMLQLAQTSKTPAEIIHGWALEATRECYRKLMETGDYNGALKAINQLARLGAQKSQFNSEKTMPDELEIELE